MRKFNASWLVWFYIPNLLGYFRIFLLMAVVYCFFSRPVQVFIFYFIFSIIDAVDGAIAKWLRQQSKLGAMLDFVVDRIGLAVIAVGLGIMYPSFWGVFLAVLLLDMGSHYSQLFLAMSCAEATHKLAGIRPRSLLAKYYDQQKRGFMLYCCFSHDMFLAMCYWYLFYPKAIVITLGILLLPGFLLKTWIHVLQIINAASILSRAD